MRKLLLGMVLATGASFGAHADNGPPLGNVIYSLTGQAISSSYQEGSASFVADSTTTDLSFAIREDPAFIQLSDISLVDVTAGSGNLLVNGDFAAGPVGANQPTGWQYLNEYGASFAGFVASGCGYVGDNCYYDGAVGSYDGINQAVDTTVGDTYDVTFYYLDTDGEGTYAPTGDGRDVFVYAGDSIPVAAPEPASMAIIAAGLASLGAIRRRRRSA